MSLNLLIQQSLFFLQELIDLIKREKDSFKVILLNCT